MRIAQVAPPWESVPPALYGGTERIVSYLTEELVRLGHEVTLFASGDSVTRARLEPICPSALRLCTEVCDYDAPPVGLASGAFTSLEFDVVHSHLDRFAFPLARRCPVPVLTTLHGRLDRHELAPVFRAHADLPLVSISDAQRRPIPWANWRATVHHGLPRDLYRFHPLPGRYLAFLGRMSPEKRPDHAIQLARALGVPLRIAAKVDPTDGTYYEDVIRPLLDHPLIEYVGEITDAEKDDFLGEALALVAPYDWPEPFGLVLIEAMACGTPVVAYRRGSIPEIVEDGVTGFVCDSLEELMLAIERVPALDRAQCRKHFEAHFTVERMVQDYLRVYAALIRDPRLESASEDLALPMTSRRNVS